MNEQQKKQIERMRRTAEFGTSFENDFAPSSKGRPLLAELKELLHEVESKVKKPRGRGPARGYSSPKQQALKTLRDDLEHISRTARLIETHNPALAGKFIMPDKRRKDELASAARQFIRDAQPLKAEFYAYELPPTFLDDLEASLSNYENSEAKPQDPAQPAKNNADNTIKGFLTRGSQLVDALDVVIHNKYRGQLETLAAWESAKAVESTPGKRRGRKPRNAPAE
jgi:hypothetical protein